MIPDVSKKNNSERIAAVLVFFIILILGLLAFLPVLPYFKTLYCGWAGDARGEFENFIWRHWWFSKLFDITSPESHGDALRRLFLIFALPSDVNYTYFPDYILSYFLTKYAGMPAAWNARFILVFFLNIFSGYLLGRKIFKTRTAALVLALFFGMTPYVFSWMQEGVPAYAFLIGFSAWGWVRFMKKPGILNALVAALFYAVAGAWFWYNLLFMGLFFLVYGAGYLFSAEKGSSPKHLPAYLIVFILAFIVFILPFTAPFWKMKALDMKPMGQSAYTKFPVPGEINKAELPPAEFRNNAGPGTIYAQSFSPGELFWSKRRGFIPVILWVMVLISLFIIPKRKFMPWILSSLLFFILLLGPYLKISGAVTGVPMPYLFLLRVFPYMGIFYWLPYMTIYLVMSLAVIAGGGADVISSKIGSGYRLAVFILLAGILIMELINHGVYPVSAGCFKAPAFYYMLASDKRDFGIIETPAGWDSSIINVFQVIHQKKILGSAVRRPPYFGEIVNERYIGRQYFPPGDRFLEFLDQLQQGGIPDIKITREDMEAVKSAGYRYLVFHRFYGPIKYDENDDRLNAVKKALGPPLYDMGEIVVFKL
ncbi:MAG: hypothetical protein M1269_06970 [Chloroflexi bacterium]|nr:hypothetical protein [Chloroflexota bacterium]